MEKAESVPAALWNRIFPSRKIWKSVKKRKEKCVESIPASSISSLIVVYSALNAFEWMVYFSSIAALFHFFPRTVAVSHLLCGSTPLSICSHANDTGGISQEGMNSWEMENKSAYSSFNQAADGCVMLEPVVGSVYLHEATEMEEGKPLWQPSPICRFSISVFLTQLTSSAWISLLFIQTADFLKVLSVWLQPPPALLLTCFWRGALP